MLISKSKNEIKQPTILGRNADQITS